jgi:alkanesulfonate monooxygenase SsuD/methylene tetrahydromethanopterin reductase-like flavin-dependent oxidoreductase (luciferase family)
MKFDVFHSVGRIDSITPRLQDDAVFRQFLSQCQLAESLGFGTIWVAESHFSSEVQKSNSEPVIPHYNGEVGLNSDCLQLAHLVFSRTKKIGFGTAIHNIVGGNGGPLASADRVNSLVFLNQFLETPRKLDIGFAAGRFPYINAPFGIVPRTDIERDLWPVYKRIIFMEATEIFLRLIRSETLSSEDVSQYKIDRSWFRTDEEWQMTRERLSIKGESVAYAPRWSFEKLKLTPQATKENLSHLNLVLGSHDPSAHDLASKYFPIDVFNLSFTPSHEIDKVHASMSQKFASTSHPWRRDRMPRTVLTFIDRDQKKAEERASACFDTYIEAMRGTVGTPPKDVLMSRALIGEPAKIIELLEPKGKLGFQSDDRLMLWFEFNQADGSAVEDQMILFTEEVSHKFA